LKRWWALLAPLVAAACGEEGPTEAGAGLLPPDAVRTFEIIVEPHQYLVMDTAFGLYSDPADATFTVVASRFDDGLDSHALVRFTLPVSMAVVDTLGVGRLDTVPVFVGGTIRMLVDTLRSTAPPVRLALYRTAEEWDRSATWTHRVDTAGVQLAWTMPGGTRGVLVDTASYTAESDTVVFRVDSATMAAWRNTDDPTRGALIVAETAGARLRMTVPLLEAHAVSAMRPDTVYDLFAATQRRTFIFSPEQPDFASAPRVGGTPAWRSIFELRDRLDTLSFACPGVPNCRVRLGEATINHAGLLLQPVPPPAGLRPEGDLVLGAYTLAPTPLIPLQRSPLQDLIGVATVPRSRFMAPDAPVVELTITEMIRRAAMPPEQRPAAAEDPSHFVLTPGADPLFGFGTFASMPRLRLIVSTARELQLP
jgi:hypothetical protein